MSNILLTTMLCGLLPIVPAMADDDIDNSTVAIKQFERFLGKWYEIARFDHKFERGQESTTAYYTKNDDGTLVVENSGWKNEKAALNKTKSEIDKYEKSKFSNRKIFNWRTKNRCSPKKKKR